MYGWAALALWAGCLRSSGGTDREVPVFIPVDASALADAAPPVDARRDARRAHDATTARDVASLDAPAEAAPIVRISDGAAAMARANCAFARGAMPAATLGVSTAVGGDIPIDHIVVLVQENHSFDTYLGHLQRYEASRGIHNTIESAPDTASNPRYPADQPLPDGGLPTGPGPAESHAYQHAPALCIFDPAHSWEDNHVQYDHGLNDGFFHTSDGHGGGESIAGIAPAYLTGDRVLWWYDERDLPFAYQLYGTFAMSDAYFSDVLGPTYPNRMYLYAGTSFGETANYSPRLSDVRPIPTPIGGVDEAGTIDEYPALIFDALEKAGVSWGVYAEGTTAVETVFDFWLNDRYSSQQGHTYPQFVSDAQAGKLPTVTFVDADFNEMGTNDDDEHPPGQIEIGQHYVWQIVNAVLTSPLWSRTVLFVTYDDPGGTYDHVPPPSACVPDAIAPVYHGKAAEQSAQFDRFGFRVPFVVISPYARPAYVSHTAYSHASILRFIEAKLNLGALTARDANADALGDLFDWQHPSFLTPPTFPEPKVDWQAVVQCAAHLSPSVTAVEQWMRLDEEGRREQAVDWLGRRRKVY